MSLQLPDDTAFLTAALAAAVASGHIFPDWAACEAAHASKWGTIPAAVKGNNLFDFRVPAKRGPGTLTIPMEHASKLVMRLRFASWEDCFRHRAEWIQAVTMFYLVRRAKTGDEYIAEMNKLASNPATYGPEIKAIYAANEAIFNEHAGIGG
jgi:hypothetical protein